MKPTAYCIAIMTLFASLNLFPQEQAVKKKNSVGEDRPVHSLGNGHMLVYEQGPLITHLYPGPFSTPSLCTVILQTEGTEIRTEREKGTAIWHHEIIAEHRQVAQLTDFVDHSIACLVRHIETSRELTFEIKLHRSVRYFENKQHYDTKKIQGGILVEVPSGTLIYQTYTYPRILYHQIAWQGPMIVARAQNEPEKIILHCQPGVSNLFFIGGPEYPQVIQNTEQLLAIPYPDLLLHTRACWQEYTKKRIDFAQRLPPALPLRERLLQVIDDLAVLIKTQQSDQGSVIAGYPYPLGYVRDQYGVSRGLLALGYTEEAKAILNFYWQVWKKYGTIHNAQTIGLENVQFHIHENDEVESPGYLLMQSFDLLEKTSDSAFQLKIFPMLEWAFEVQKKHIVKGMLPFNGDETYIAGGVLPRSVLNDGSAEATMLFLDSGERLLSWIQKNKLWDSTRLTINQTLFREVKGQFLANFWQNSHLITNNPKRAVDIELPRFRHGVCERAGEQCLFASKSGLGGICWTERDANGRYQCPNCLALGPLAKAEAKIFDIPSVGLTPFYFHSRLFTPDQLQSLFDYAMSKYNQSADTASTNRSVGYDFGFLLYAACQADHAHAVDLYKKTLGLADAAGAWSEYYVHSQPQGTRCRPWESAINLEALLLWADKYNKAE